MDGVSARSDGYMASLSVWLSRAGMTLAGGASLLAVACSQTPPPLWAEGGAPLIFGTAVWTQVDGSQLYLDGNGHVSSDGELVMTLDPVGRVVDDSNDPVALLDPDGQLFGTNKAYLGRVGVHNAAPPWSPEAWLRVSKTGTVTLFDTDGETVSGGQWSGCEGAVLRVCTLLTHLAMLESVQQTSPRPPHYTYPGWFGPYPYWGPYWGTGFGFYY